MAYYSKSSTVIFLVLFVIFSVVGGSTQIGPSTLRVYMTCILLIYLFLNKRKFQHIRVDSNPVRLYVAFIVITLLAKALSMSFIGNGVDEIQIFLKRIFSLYLVAIVGYYGVSYIINSEKKVRQVLAVLVIIGCVNAIISYLQYIGNPYGMRIALMFNAGEGDYMRAYMNLTGAVRDVNFVVPGIFGTGASNGYMTSSLGVLTLYYVGQQKLKQRIFGIVAFGLAIVGSYVTQERAGFGLLLALSMFILYKYANEKNKIIIAVLSVIFLVLYSESFIETLRTEDLGRYSNFVEFGEDRYKLLNNALSFIQDNWLLGGEETYHSMRNVTPHNFFLHAIIYSGIFGLITISLLFIVMLKRALLELKKNTNKSIAIIYFASALIIYLLNGLFHSSSLITGDVLIWILYALLLRCASLENYKKEHFIQKDESTILYKV